MPSKKPVRRKVHLAIFGLSLPSIITCSFTRLFIALSSCYIFVSVLRDSLQAKVTHIEGFDYPQFIPVIETLTFAFCALLEVLLSGGRKGHILSPKAPILNYIVLSTFTFGGMFCAYSARKYISKPIRMIFKVTKPVPTMILEYLYIGKIFTLNEIISVIILVIGMIIFSSADTVFKLTEITSDAAKGYGLMIFCVIFDSITSNFEKKTIFKTYKSTHCEAMFFASIFGFIYSLIILMSTDPDLLHNGFYFFITTPTAILWLILSSIIAYMTMVLVLILIGIYSTTYTECIKDVRRLYTVSIHLYLNKDTIFGFYHLCGVTSFILSSIIIIYTKSVKSKRKMY